PPGVPLYPDSPEVAISPDGTQVAFVVGTPEPGSPGDLWVRRLDSLVARPLGIADSARLPFWSPDSRRIGYFTKTKLCTIAVEGGRAETVADAGNGRGGAWAPSNVIVFAPEAIGPLLRVPASGGTPVAVTKLDPARGELGHRMPSFLP